MHLEEFAEGESPLHRMDPRAKFIAVTPLLIMTAIAPDYRGPAYALLVSIVLAVIAKLAPMKLLERLLGVNLFVLFLWLILPFSQPGVSAYTIGPFTATNEGIMLAFQITLKTNAIVITTLATLGTTEVMNLAHALVHMHVPKKLVYLFFFFYRYISVLHEEYTRLRTAMRTRCFHLHMSKHTYRSLANLIGMLLVRSFERSERIYDAMLCRGFHGHFPVSRHFTIGIADIALSIAILTSAVGVPLL